MPAHEADEFYTRPDGVEEVAWMRPHRDLIDGLPSRVPPLTRRALHAMVDEVYTRGRADADEEAGLTRQLNRVIFGAALRPAFAAPGEPSANLHDPDVLAEALQLAHERVPHDAADSGPRAADLHQAADQAEAAGAARTDDAAVQMGPGVPQRLVAAAQEVDILPGLLARVSDAVVYVDALRKTWITNGNLREDSETNEQLGVLVVAASWAANGVIAARVGAEERQRIAALIRENAGTIDSFARDGSPAGLIAYLIDDVLAAGSAVPATTPQAAADAETLRELAPADSIIGDAMCEIADRLGGPGPCQLCAAGDHAACSAARQDSWCCCPVPFVGPVVATPEPCHSCHGDPPPREVFDCCGGSGREPVATPPTGTTEFVEAWGATIYEPLVAAPEHDAACGRASGGVGCYCRRRADAEFSHTVGPVATPTESAAQHEPFTDDGVTYCGWDGHEGCGELWPCSYVRAEQDGQR